MTPFQWPSKHIILSKTCGIVAKNANQRTAMLIFEKTTKKADFINPLPNDECFDMTKLKASADDKLNVAKMPTSLCDRVENTVGKEENAGFVWERVTHETLPEWLPQ